MEVTIEQLKKMFPGGKEKLFVSTIDEINKCFKKFNLDSCLAYSHFFAHFRQETDYVSFEESLNYSQEQLISTFSKFRNNRELAVKYGRSHGKKANQEMIGNIAYGDRKELGNRGINSGDGYKYRGRGLIQVTGRSNYMQATQIYNKVFEENIDFVSNPDLILQPKYAVRASFADLLNKKCETYVNIIEESKNGIEKYRKAFDLIMDKINKHTKSREKRWKYFKENFMTIFQCSVKDKVVLKNDSNDDNKNINKQSKTLEKSNVKGEAVEDKEGVYIFNGQKFQEVWDNEEYKKDRAENKKAPDIVFVNSNEVVLKRLQAKFQDESMYNKDYVKYIETTTAKKVLDENKEDINVILKIYDEATKNNENIGNVIRQHGFDLLRGRDGINEVLKIQDIIYYIFSYPIPNKSKIESLEYVLSQYSAKYVLFPDRKPLRENSENKELSLEKIKNIVNEVNTGNENVSERKVEKNNLPEKYNKYMEGIKDIDEIVIRVTKKPSSEFSKMKCENLIRELGESDEHRKSYLTDENGVRHFPLARRLIDNIIIEFLKIQTGFKEEKEIKYFDNHKYKDSNIVRNYLLWYVEKQNGIDLPSKNENGLYNRLEKLGKEMRVTTILNDWINSKSAIKVRNIRKISNLIDEVYSEYRDNNDFEKDKSIIHNLFKDSKELRDYAANIDSMDLYSFYRKFYDLKNIVKPNQEMFVNDNCMLKCTLGQDISRLIIAEDSVTLKGGKQANINDKKIMPFKMCKAIGICKPELLAMWEKNTDVKVRNHPALLDISTIQCKYGGTVSIDDAGQKEMGTAVTENKKTEEAQRDADCEYKLLIDICRDINNNFMQTELKKSSQKYAKWRKYKQETEKRAVEYLKNDVKEVLGMGKADEKKKKEYEKFVKDNKKKMEIAKTEASETREKELKNKIMSTFLEANKRVKQLSGPKLDTKGVIRKSGISLCDYERKNFYSAKILPAIVYGYLMKAGNLNMDSQERQTIENELNKDAVGIGTVNIDLTGYGIDSKFKKSKDSQKMKIPSSEIMTWVGIGESLYATVKNIPTEWDIQNKIREQGKSVGRCPFNQMEWNQNHKENKPLKDVPPLPETVTEKDKSDKISSNKETGKIVPDKKNETGKSSSKDSAESFCKGDNCPHVGVEKKAPWIKIAQEQCEKYKGKKEGNEPLYSQIKNVYFVIAKHEKKDPTKEAWCAAFISYCINKAGFKNSSYPSVAGYDWGVAPRKGLPRRGWFEGEKTKPFVGAIGVFKWHNGYSHVAILIGKTPKGAHVFLGGNQNNEINVTAYSEKRIDYYMKPKSYTISSEEWNLPIITKYKNSGSIG
ncbi:PAAR-like protein [Pseudoleptotrichia goodfellowii]|uniref:Peptidase C51 domain-containing protein n=1 Tax=Pseudoleptotrichia goodfellowii TaxID=157692 RepID=A0A510J7U0_9FUSO|nr:PAAR-like protein [Pseudoleptotrichia goodfellowii]BBM35298.1 hypothetical protein JCM16774_0205 [Pseudoleptotrichia goodfellowii]